MTTSVTVDDLFDPAALQTALREGHVREQRHPTLPLRILNYTEKATFEQAWTPVTLACRGLIVDASSGQIVARPMRKFFNVGQAGAPGLDLTGEVVVTDKLDGSLGILFPTPTGHAVATRGSFASEQARHATGVWLDRYAGSFRPEPGVTYLFEIVYPQNRIVCDYGDLDDLLLLGAIEVATGADLSDTATAAWPGPRAERFPYATLAEALAAPPRPNAEGLVVHFVASGERVKLKQQDYLELHKIVTGLTARTVWDFMLTGAPLAELIAPLPDEFHDWVRGVADGILKACADEQVRLAAEFAKTTGAMPAGWAATDRAGRKDFALVAAGHPDKWALFAQLDGRDLGPELLKRAKPEPFVTPAGRAFTEDTA
jgi:RNA ligase